MTPDEFEAALVAFRAAWHEADEAGRPGERSREGLRAALDVILTPEYGVRWPAGNVGAMEEADARRFARAYADVPNGGAPVLMRRWTTPWEVTS